MVVVATVAKLESAVTIVAVTDVAVIQIIVADINKLIF